MYFSDKSFTKAQGGQLEGLFSLLDVNDVAAEEEAEIDGKNFMNLYLNVLFAQTDWLMISLVPESEHEQPMDVEGSIMNVID